MYIYIYVYVCVYSICIWEYVYIYIYVCMCVYVCMYMYRCIHMSMYLCIHQYERERARSRQIVIESEWKKRVAEPNAEAEAIECLALRQPDEEPRKRNKCEQRGRSEDTMTLDKLWHVPMWKKLVPNPPPNILQPSIDPTADTSKAPWAPSR